MIRGHLGEEARHQRANHPRDDHKQPARFSHLHQTKEQSHHTDQANREFHRSGSRIEHAGRQGLHRRWHSFYGDMANFTPGGGRECNEDYGEEDPVH